MIRSLLTINILLAASLMHAADDAARAAYFRQLPPPPPFNSTAPLGTLLNRSFAMAESGIRNSSMGASQSVRSTYAETMGAEEISLETFTARQNMVRIMAGMHEEAFMPEQGRCPLTGNLFPTRSYMLSSEALDQVSNAPIDVAEFVDSSANTSVEDTGDFVGTLVSPLALPPMQVVVAAVATAACTTTPALTFHQEKKAENDRIRRLRSIQVAKMHADESGKDIIYYIRRKGIDAIQRCKETGLWFDIRNLKTIKNQNR